MTSSLNAGGSVIDLYQFQCREWMILRGFIRTSRIPHCIRDIVWIFYYRSQIALILDDERLKRLSINLVYGSYGAFPRFVLQEMICRGDHFWRRCERVNHRNSAIMDETQFLYLWYILDRSFRKEQAAQRSRSWTLCSFWKCRASKTKSDSSSRRSISNKEFHHLAAWILNRFCVLQNGQHILTLQREGFAEWIIEGLESYRHQFGAVLHG